MHPLTVALVAFNSALVLVWLFLWFWSRLVNCHPKTIPEAAVRGLYYAARWLKALAEALDSGILCYRDMKQDLVRPRAELYRRLKTDQAVHIAELDKQIERQLQEERES